MSAKADVVLEILKAIMSKERNLMDLNAGYRDKMIKQAMDYADRLERLRGSGEGSSRT